MRWKWHLGRLLRMGLMAGLLESGAVKAGVPWSEVPRALGERVDPGVTAGIENETGPGAGEASPSLEGRLGALGVRQESEGLFWDLGKTAVALAAVCGLAYVFLRYGLQRFSMPRNKGEQRFHVVERYGLEPKKVLYIMEIEGRRVLLASGESGISFLTHLEDPMVGSAPGVTAVISGSEPGSSFLQVLQRKLDRPTLERAGAGKSEAPGLTRGEVS